MFKIGDFSSLNKVSVKTLRYYDEIGLLKPVQIDQASGYRYYSASQLPRLHKILALKDMEFSLTDIALMLNSPLTAKEACDMMHTKASALEHEIRMKQSRLERIRAYLQTANLEELGKGMGKDMKVDLVKSVVLKEVESIAVAGIRTTLEDYAHQQPLWEELIAYVIKYTRIQTPIAIYYGSDGSEGPFEIEVAVPVNGQLPETERIRLHPLEGVQEMACFMHEGTPDRLNDSYAALQHWMELNSYQIAGPVREVHLEGYLSNPKPEEHMTEIQIPVTKAAIK